MEPDGRFERTLSAVLDGTPVSPSPGDSPLVEHLFTLHRIAGAHRQFMGDEGEPSPERPGTTRWGHLEIGEPLGRGASATVYRAWDPKLGREVALKLFDTVAAAGTEALREGQWLANFRHPHLVTVYGAGTFDGTSGVWMELVHGETVDAIVERSGPWAVEAVLVAGRDLASALGAIHDRDLLHRDVKARNVVREHGGRIVLMDMGAGRERGTVEESDEKGTPLYMAPELFDGASASERSDVYSLGVLLSYVLSGSYPVEAESWAALVEAHRQRRASPLAARCATLPPPVTALVDRLCSADPEARPSSAREAEGLLGDCLRALASDRCRVPTWIERWWDWTARPLAALAAATVLAALLALVTWDTVVTRNVTLAAGARAPSSPLFLVSQGRLRSLTGGRLVTRAAVPLSTGAIAVSSLDGMAASFGGGPPFEQGGLRMPMFGGEAEALATPPICCFTDGTTDGHDNYAVRREDTRTPGARDLAPAGLYRFSRGWVNPERLFDLDPSPIYNGVTYLPVDDTFVFTRQGTNSGGRLEKWSRGGRRLAVLAGVEGYIYGVAYDPADRTLWVERLLAPSGGKAQLVAFDLAGRSLGAMDLPAEMDAVGIEFALPDAEPWLSRTCRRLQGWLQW